MKNTCCYIYSQATSLFRKRSIKLIGVAGKAAYKRRIDEIEAELPHVLKLAEVLAVQ